MDEFDDLTFEFGVMTLPVGGVTTDELTAALAGLAPSGATYITQTSNGTLSAEQALDALSGPGIAKVEASGAISLAVGSDLPAHNHTGVVFSYTFTFAGSPSIATGVPDYYARGIIVPVGATVTGWVIDGDGTAVVTIQRATNGAPGTFSAISGSEKPTIASGTTNSDTNLTTWTGSGAIAALDRLRPSVDSAAATALSVTLLFTRSI